MFNILKNKNILIILCLILNIFPFDQASIPAGKDFNAEKARSSFNPPNFYSLFRRDIYAESLKESPTGSPTEPSDSAYNNYINLKKLYLKWNTGLFRSSRYYKKYMIKYLISIYNKAILTDFDFVIISPEGRYDKKLICNLYSSRWLQIRGDVKDSGLTDIIKKEPDLLTKWWRSEKLLSVYGVVRDFKLESDVYGNIVILFLKDIKIRESKTK